MRGLRSEHGTERAHEVCKKCYTPLQGRDTVSRRRGRFLRNDAAQEPQAGALTGVSIEMLSAPVQGKCSRLLRSAIPHSMGSRTSGAQGAVAAGSCRVLWPVMPSERPTVSLTPAWRRVAARRIAVWMEYGLRSTHKCWQQSPQRSQGTTSPCFTPHTSRRSTISGASPNAFTSATKLPVALNS